MGIHELWGRGTDYETLHASIRSNPSQPWLKYQDTAWRMTIDGYQGARKMADQRAIIETFDYLEFRGPIRMKDPDVQFRVFEHYDKGSTMPSRLYVGRFIAASGRQAKTTFDLKKRHYISTTSMDAELALLTANIALAAPGKIFFDPFMGTGGFPLASANFGAYVFGSDIDGRSIRGTGGSSRRGQTGKRNVEMNFTQYGLEKEYLGAFVSDLTNTPLRLPIPGNDSAGRGYLDGIICDPPYGIREGLKVLGPREKLDEEERAKHEDKYLEPGYIPPKRPYSFIAMLDDILAFAASTLVENGRLSMWMPTANDDNIELIIPTNPYLEIVSVCVQPFNKWSRRLLTYRRLPDSEVSPGAVEKAKRELETGIRADDLNVFRRKYFEGFKELERLKLDAQRAEETPEG